MKSNEKGYTLVEILAVLAIMVAILLVAVPSITQQISGIEDGNYNQFKQTLYLAAKAHINANPDAYGSLKYNGGSACVDVYDLIREGWIKSSLKNPKTDTKINSKGSITIYKKASENDFEMSYNPTKSCK